MTHEQLLGRLRRRQPEDNFTERKPTATHANVLPTLVAFANSTPVGQSAVLFLGVTDEGVPTTKGIETVDEVQRKIVGWLKACYPPIRAEMTVLPTANVHVLAVVVIPSDERPHFSGGAWVRHGPTTEQASAEVYAELIASRNEKAGALLRQKGKLIAVQCIGCKITDVMTELGGEEIRFCIVQGCTAHYVDLFDQSSHANWSKSLERVRIISGKQWGLELGIQLLPLRTF